MADHNGTPTHYRCPHTGRIATPQLPVKRDTASVTLVEQYEVLRQLRINHFMRKERER
jgi:hypothetical protein